MAQLYFVYLLIGKYECADLLSYHGKHSEHYLINMYKHVCVAFVSIWKLAFGPEHHCAQGQSHRAVSISCRYVLTSKISWTA